MGLKITGLGDDRREIVIFYWTGDNQLVWLVHFHNDRLLSTQLNCQNLDGKW